MVFLCLNCFSLYEHLLLSTTPLRSSDNVTIHLDGVLYVRIVDAHAASYGVEDPEFAVSQLAQTTMRSELGTLRESPVE